jgi:hypothetical protein
LQATSEEIQRNRAKDIADEQKRKEALAKTAAEAIRQGEGVSSDRIISAKPTPW